MHQSGILRKPRQTYYKLTVIARGTNLTLLFATPVFSFRFIYNVNFAVVQHILIRHALTYKPEFMIGRAVRLF